ncbi:ribbon-helix-helix protein, CopG family [Candidatus Pacearchaeota archaeon]|nr:ribbon-helix-helix protein, CopG family [Candidatus Pacearchaeota archaeon]
MKERISATIDKETIKDIEEILKKGDYRNKSHVIEKAIKTLKEKEKEDAKRK